MNMASVNTRTLWGLSLFAFALSVLFGLGCFKYYAEVQRSQSDIRFARDIIRSVHIQRDIAIESSVSNAVSHLYKMQGALPGAPPFRNLAAELVEMERKRDVKDVIGHLRMLTGKDLGDNPDAWIQQYGDEQLKSMQKIMKGP